MLSHRCRSILSMKYVRSMFSRSSTRSSTDENSKELKIDKKPIKRSMYAYKRSQTTYYDWIEAVNRVDIPHHDFHRPLIIRWTVRQILRYMHDGYITNEQWSSFRDYLVRKDIGVSRLFDGIFLDECVNHQRLLMALSYLHHLQSEQIPLTPTGLAMHMYLARQFDIRPDYKEYRIDEEIILKSYDEFLFRQAIPDSTLALPVIAGLTLTVRWKEALKYLPILDNDLDGLQQALGFVLAAAAAFHDYEFFFSLLDSISQTESVRLREERQRITSQKVTSPTIKLEQKLYRPVAPSRIKESDYFLIAKTSQAYETFTNYLTGEHQQQIDILIRLLEKTASNGYIPPKSFVEALSKKLHQLDPDRYHCDYVFFYPNGQSVDGKTSLPSIHLSDEQENQLHQAVKIQFRTLLEQHCPKCS